MTAFVANTNVLDLIGLKNELSGASIDNATVTVTIKDDQGVNVAGATWPLTMSYVAASAGDYRAFLSEDLGFIAKGKYIAAIDADGGTNLVGHWELNFKPLARTVSETD
jgi:hypothetical protein